MEIRHVAAALIAAFTTIAVGIGYLRATRDVRARKRQNARGQARRAERLGRRA